MVCDTVFFFLPCHEEHGGEQHAYYPGAYVYILYLAGEYLHEDIGDKAEGYAVGDVIGEGHACHGHERRKGGGRIAPLYFLNAAYHQYADVYQGCGSGAAWHKRGYGRKEHGYEEHGCGEYGGKAGAAAFRYARGGFNKRSNGGGAADRAEAGSRSIGKHGLIHIGHVAFLIKQLANGAGAVEGAEGIEHIHHAECKHGCNKRGNEAARAVCRYECGEIKAFCEYLAEGKAEEIAEGLDYIERKAALHMLCIEVFYCDETQRIVGNGAADYAPEHRALDVFLSHGGYCYKCEYGHEQRHNFRPCGVAEHKVEGMKVNKRCIAVHNYSAVLKAEERYEQANARCYRGFYGLGDSVEYNAAKAGDGKHKEYYAVHKNHHKRVSIGEVHSYAYREYKKCIKPHAGSLSERQVCKQTDQKRTEYGGYSRCNINGVIISIAKYGEHARIDHKNVRHRHERGNAGDKLRAYGRVVLFNVEHFYLLHGYDLDLLPTVILYQTVYP